VIRTAGRQDHPSGILLVNGGDQGLRKTPGKSQGSFQVEYWLRLFFTIIGIAENLPDDLRAACGFGRNKLTTIPHSTNRKHIVPCFLVMLYIVKFIGMIFAYP